MKWVLCVVALSLNAWGGTQHDNRIYNPDNPFWGIIHEQLVADEVVRNKDMMSFRVVEMRVKNHYLAVPTSGFISFPHFIDNANYKQIVSLIRGTAETAEKLNLVDTGYRIITNHAMRPGSKTRNNAFQEIPHLHIHIAGAECLGLPVSGFENQFPQSSELIDSSVTRNAVDMSVADFQVPYGLDLTPEQLVSDAKENKIMEEYFAINDKKYHLLGYRIQHSSAHIPEYFGVLLLDHNDKPLYKSFHEFAKNGDNEEIVETLRFTRRFAASMGMDSNGYRLVSNTGNDAWNLPNVFQIMIAGGTTLGVTITNVWGNWNLAQNTAPKRSLLLSEMSELPHQHCPLNLSELRSLRQKVINPFKR